MPLTLAFLLGLAVFAGIIFAAAGTLYIALLAAAAIWLHFTKP